MDVYVVPVGAGQYELYCEPADDPGTPHPEPVGGLWRAMLAKFSAVLAAVEREHGQQADGAPAPPGAGWFIRRRARAMCWLAERIAEQRLLWRLRGQARVRAVFPASIDEGRALSVVRGMLRADADRHRRWLVVDAIGMVVLGIALTPFPGPNLPGYYFTFRVVGHFLALRGARHALADVEWVLQPSALLTELGEVRLLPSLERDRRVHAIAGELGLPGLARFFERTALETA
jgi:hypothetical protein